MHYSFKAAQTSASSVNEQVVQLVVFCFMWNSTVSLLFSEKFNYFAPVIGN